ncbi:MAG: SpoIIE family protein phosphatase [Acidobacteria bacterium]|nr:SpoIIE family protein phosphatase [Acidobacteriota bacterium]
MSNPTPRLVITDAQGRQQIRLDQPVITVGRRTESDVRIVGAGVSRHHAEITVEAGVCRLRDCDSKLGTFVNGVRATEHALVHGDLIRLAELHDTRIEFLIGDEDLSRADTGVSAVTELRQVAGLLEGLRALGSGRVVHDVLALVLDSAIDVTGAERGFIMLANTEGHLEFRLGRARGRVTLSGQTFETSRKIPEDVFATGRQRIVEDLLDGAEAGQHMGIIEMGIRHVLCTPLRLVRYVEKAEEGGEERRIGVLYLDSRERGRLRSQLARTALETLSAEAAIAIENARLYRAALERSQLDQEIKIAASIQQALLPASNRTGSFFSTAGTSVPCRSVGGDFFDYTDLSDGQFGFILGDVAGKGPPAALLAAMALGMFDAESSHQARCAPVVTTLNRGVASRGISGRFITAFYATLAADGSLLFSNAGHNAPILISGTEVRRLETGGMVLGMFEHATFEEEAVALAPGDVIVAFSDGVSEAMNEAEEEYTDERLIAAVHANRGCAPEALLDALLADVRRFCGKATPNDDVTMVVVRYDG